MHGTEEGTLPAKDAGGGGHMNSAGSGSGIAIATTEATRRSSPATTECCDPNGPRVRHLSICHGHIYLANLVGHLHVASFRESFWGPQANLKKVPGV